MVDCSGSLPCWKAGPLSAAAGVLAERAAQGVVAAREVQAPGLVPALWATHPRRETGIPLPAAVARAQGAGAAQVAGVVWAAQVAAGWAQAVVAQEDALGPVAQEA